MMKQPKYWVELAQVISGAEAHQQQMKEKVQNKAQSRAKRGKR